MINMSVITAAVEVLLNAELNDDYTIERNEYINMDFEKTAWVGIYRGTFKYTPQTLGRGLNAWRANPSIRIIVQASSLDSAEAAEDELEGYIEEVLDAIMTDITLGGTVAMINEINVSYGYNETESETIYSQNAELELITEVRTS